MSNEDDREKQARHMLYVILGCYDEQLAPLTGRSVRDTLDALLSLTRGGYVAVATNRDGFSLELTEKGLARVERRTT